MAKAKVKETIPGRNCIVMQWNGYNRESQVGYKKDNDTPIQWQFSIEEAEIQCRKQIKAGALRAEVWNSDTKEKLLGFERTHSGSCNQVFPTRGY